MKVLSEYQFKNDKAIRVLHLNRTDQKRLGVPDCDSLALCFVDGENERRHYIRPDEAVIIVRLLADGLFKSIAEYGIGLARYDGFR